MRQFTYRLEDVQHALRQEKLLAERQARDAAARLELLDACLAQCASWPPELRELAAMRLGVRAVPSEFA